MCGLYAQQCLTYNQHWCPDSLRDALPQLRGGARFVEPPGKLPGLRWSGSHGAAHLSSDSQVGERQGYGEVSQAVQRRLKSCAPGCQTCVKRQWRRFIPPSLAFNFTFAQLWASRRSSGGSRRWLSWPATTGDRHAEPPVRCPVSGGHLRALSRPHSQYKWRSTGYT